MKVKLVATVTEIKNLLNCLDLSTNGNEKSEITLNIDLNIPKNKELFDSINKINVVNLPDNYQIKPAEVQAAELSKSGYSYGVLNQYPSNTSNQYGFNNIMNQYSSINDPMPTNSSEFDYKVRNIVRRVLEEEYGFDPEDRDDYKTPPHMKNITPSTPGIFQGNFNTGNRYMTPSFQSPQFNTFNQEDQVINSLLKSNVSGIDLSTVNGVSALTLGIMRVSNGFTYSLNSNLIKSAIEYIRSGALVNENMSLDFNVMNKVTRLLGVDNWKYRINNLLRYSAMKSMTLNDALNYMYS